MSRQLGHLFLAFRSKSVWVVGLGLSLVLPLLAQSSTFTYQGHLRDNGIPANGNYDLQFKLYDTPSGGTPLGTVERTNVNVSKGLFTVQLDFGSSPFTGARLWLEIALRRSGSGGYTTLSPRVELTTTPYAIFAQRAPWGGLIGIPPGFEDGIDNEFTLPFSGSVNTNLEAFSITNTGTGKAAVFRINNINSGTNALEASHNGMGRVAFFEASNTNNSSVAVEIRSHGLYSTALQGSSSGLDGNGFVGVANIGADAYGVWGQSTEGYAGFFSGKVHVNGTLSKSGGSFKIDHPLDPANKYLSHSFVESPDMKNVYDGVVVLDANGEAWVELPEWFEALNKDFRYQLTPIGAPAPNLHIAEKIRNNRFKIAGGRPGMEVSWMVTGIRHDPWAEKNRIQVEQEKAPHERGYYLHPELYGQPPERRIENAHKRPKSRLEPPAQR